MSRTKRNYGYDLSNRSKNFDKTWIGIGNYWHHDDPRNAWENGYDGVNPSIYYVNYLSGGWNADNYQYKSRRFYKRYYHKVYRRYHKREMMRDVLEMQTS